MPHTQLITPEWILPLQYTPAEKELLTKHSLVLVDDTIQDILPSEQARTQYAAASTAPELELPGQLLMPGLINMHTHLAMNIYRGLADDLPLMTWLNQHIWPAEKSHMHADSVALGSELAIAEMLRCGITCFNDHYFFADTTAQVAANCGIRAQLGAISLDVENAWGQGADHMLQRSLQATRDTPATPLLRWALAPHSPYMLNDAQLAAIAEHAEQQQMRVHIHLHETAQEIEHNLEHYQQRPIMRLQRLGLINSQLIAVHMVHLQPEEIELIAAAGVHVVHCPESNLKLGSGIMPYYRLQQAGVNISLGTDGAVSNNDLDLLAEARCAALLHKGYNHDPTILPCTQALRMLTINAAHALGWEDSIGSLEPGKQADMISINLEQLNTQPNYNPISNIIYACNSRQVQHVWVAGKQLLRDGTHTNIDTAKLQQVTHQFTKKIIN